MFDEEKMEKDMSTLFFAKDVDGAKIIVDGLLKENSVDYVKECIASSYLGSKSSTIVSIQNNSIRRYYIDVLRDSCGLKNDKIGQILLSRGTEGDNIFWYNRSLSSQKEIISDLKDLEVSNHAILLNILEPSREGTYLTLGLRKEELKEFIGIARGLGAYYPMIDVVLPGKLTCEDLVVKERPVCAIAEQRGTCYQSICTPENS